MNLAGDSLGGRLALEIALRRPYPYPPFDESIEDPYPHIPERLPSVNTPTLLLWGALDPYYPLSQGRQAQKLIPGARLVMIKGRGQSPCKEKPGEVQGHMLNFVTA